MGLVAGFIKTLPQRMVGLATLVGLLPGFAQGTQVFLNFSTTWTLCFRAGYQPLGLADQLLTQLVGTPTLPTLQVSSLSQQSLGFGLQLRTQPAGMFFQGMAQLRGHLGQGFAVALLQLGGQMLDGCLHLVGGMRLGLGSFLGRERGLVFVRQGFATQFADFVGPHGHGGQSGGVVSQRKHSLLQCRIKSLPHQRQLRTRVVQHGCIAQVNAVPLHIFCQFLRLRTPLGHIGSQTLAHMLRISKRLGGHHFNALGQQHSSLTLHLDAVLQIFNGLDTVGQGGFQARQWLARQRCPSSGGIALPSHCIGHIQAILSQQALGFGGPLHHQPLLGLGTLEFVQLLFQGLGRPLVPVRQLTEYLGHLFRRW